jgi:hypothetical protein
MMAAGDMKIDLQLRDLNSGETSRKTFESAEEAKAWLSARPKFTEVLGLAGEGIPTEVNDALKASRRELDDDEKKLVADLDAALITARKKAAEARQREEAAVVAKHDAEMANLTPEAPMKLRFLHNRGVTVADNADTRQPGEECLAAVKAWIEERNSWVEGRGQIVGDANLQVYPAALPEGVEDRIISGTFIPVTAPAKK